MHSRTQNNAGSRGLLAGLQKMQTGYPSPMTAQLNGPQQLRRLARCTTVEQWSLDECHFPQYGSRCRGYLWNRRPCPSVSTDPQIRSLLRRRQFEHRSVRAQGCPIFNAATFQSFFRRLRYRQTPGRRLIVALDNARYHHTKLLGLFLRPLTCDSVVAVPAALHTARSSPLSNGLGN